jgi:hypothetical protein
MYTSLQAIRTNHLELFDILLQWRNVWLPAKYSWMNFQVKRIISTHTLPATREPSVWSTSSHIGTICWMFLWPHTTLKPTMGKIQQSKHSNTVLHAIVLGCQFLRSTWHWNISNFFNNPRSQCSCLVSLSFRTKTLQAWNISLTLLQRKSNNGITYST